jgi:hypothetical protein
MTDKYPVTECSVSPSVLFRCRFCQGWIESRQSGPYHVSTTDACSCCGAGYQIDWQEGRDQPVIVMWEREAEETV